MFGKNFFILLLAAITGLSLEAAAQNLYPQPTPFTANSVFTPKPKPTVIPSLKLKLPVAQMGGVRVEVMTDTRIIFSKNDQLDSGKNRRLYSYIEGKDKLMDTGESGMPGTVIAPKDGKYMIFLYDENSTLVDVNSDGQFYIVLRMFHFDSGQSVNLGLPARSLPPKEIISGSANLNSFEYFLNGNMLSFSDAQTQNNLTSAMKYAPWTVVNINNILHLIEGTPTPVPTAKATSTPTPSPTFTPGTPKPTSTSTRIPTVDGNTRARSDINQDGVIDAQDLLIFQLDWRAERMMAE